ncbi:MAG: hypothetical protein V2A62_03490 [Candidatus Woesearchaeota archaeon]
MTTNTPLDTLLDERIVEPILRTFAVQLIQIPAKMGTHATKDVSDLATRLQSYFVRTELTPEGQAYLVGEIKRYPMLRRLYDSFFTQISAGILDKY